MEDIKKRTALETDRLIIRGFKPDDWKDLQEYVSLEGGDQV